MDIWWLAIDRHYTSYDELKYRKVVAQGWPELGNLVTLCSLVSADDSYKDTFIQAVQALERIVYNNSSHAARVMWDLLNLQAGDLVVGVEGTKVKGICELKKDGWDSYRLQAPEVYNYAQTVGFPVDWVDWDVRAFGDAPIAPAQSVQGIARLRGARQKVMNSWRNCQSST